MFKSYEDVDVKYLPQLLDDNSGRYLFIAIHRGSRWVFAQINPRKTAASARTFLAVLHKACYISISKIFTRNGKAFTERLFGSRAPDAPHGQACV